MDAGDWVSSSLALLAILIALYGNWRIGRREKARDERARRLDQKAEAPTWECSIVGADSGPGYVFVLRHLAGAAPVETQVHLVDAPGHLGFTTSQDGVDRNVPWIPDGPPDRLQHAARFGALGLGSSGRKRFTIDGVRPDRLTATVISGNGETAWTAVVPVVMPDWAAVTRHVFREHGQIKG